MMSTEFRSECHDREVILRYSFSRDEDGHIRRIHPYCVCLRCGRKCEVREEGGDVHAN